MKRLLLLSIGLLTLAGRVSAEPATISWTEPAAAGTLAFTTMYWCIGTGCTDWKTGPEFKKTSDNGNGGDAKSVVLQVEIREEDLPVVLRVRVTTTSTSNNETTGVIVEHTFN